MVKAFHIQSTLTDRYQTTIPAPIRKALHLGKHDKIEYTIEESGKVILSRSHDDPVLSEFLSLLAKDLQKQTEHVQIVSSSLLSRAKSLVADVEVDLESPLSDEDN